MEQKTRMILSALLTGSGHHSAAWRYPTARADGGLNFPHYWRVALKAERGKFHMIIVNDGIGTRDREVDEERRPTHNHFVQFESVTLLSAISVVTEHIGLVTTVSTTHNDPYLIARQLASLDYLSNGRAGWNVFTSNHYGTSKNVSRKALLEYALRYERTQEFTQVVTGLWDSWEDDAFLHDKVSGKYFDPEKMHVLDHQGKYFSVRGPLNVARSPQGYPVIVHADLSDIGQELAAKSADVFLTSQTNIENAKNFYQITKDKLSKYGRSYEDLKILPGVFPVIGKTLQEAQDKYNQLQELMDPDSGIALLSELIGGEDLTGYPIDGPLPGFLKSKTARNRLKLLCDLTSNELQTIRQLFMALAGPRGNLLVVGTPKLIADQLEAWYAEKAADGFNVMPPYLPGGLDDFVDLVVPILQERGLFRKEFEGKSLRENLNLRRPSNKFTMLKKANYA